jgi:uncharacterized protein (TIGR01244 family)
MKIVKLADNLAVAAQIAPGDVESIAAQGYQVLINNRPDGEEAAQPAGPEIAAAAAAAGLEYHYLPVTHTSFPGPHFDAMCELLGDRSRRVLAFCRSGTRCANLWVASVPESKRAQAMQSASQQGFDLKMAATYLATSAAGS